MFSYYGSKSKIIDYYPPPKFDKIIEPFAGSARYSLKYWDRDILLVDKYKIVIEAWRYLQSASEKDILGLPRLDTGDSLDNYKLTKAEKTFLGFTMVSGVESPRINISSWNAKNHNEVLIRISRNVHKIKHWEIKQQDYIELGNIEATWFIDPPYQFGGEHYKESNKNINFEHLSVWCKNRNGHVIVCENTKADWMDFKPMIEMQGTIHKTTEAIWTNYPTSYGINQVELFE